MKSGTQKERRLKQSSVREFYEEEYLPAARAKGFTLRTLQTIVNWLLENEIKPCKFDRYRCEKCFLGRQAEARLKNGVGKPGDEKLLREYEEHLKIVKNQNEKVKADKGDN